MRFIQTVSTLKPGLTTYSDIESNTKFKSCNSGFLINILSLVSEHNFLRSSSILPSSSS